MKKKITLIILTVICFFVVHGQVFLKHGPTGITLKPVTFSALPAWQQANTIKSLSVFQRSCRVFLKQNPTKAVGTALLPIQVSDWKDTCSAAVQIHNPSKKVAQAFFEQWFTPVEFNDGAPVEGLFTGYYLPEFDGSLVRTKEYAVPVYGVPSNLVTVHLHDFDSTILHGNWVGRVEGKKLIPYYTRKEINEGALKGLASVVVWLKNPIDRLTLEIEGSGLVRLTNGKRLSLGYGAQNGAPYTPIARVLIERGVMTYDNASMQRIRAYLDAHPEKVDSVLNQNKSVVFFRKESNENAYGSQGVALTPGYSLAVDTRWVPLGVPLWLDTTRPHEHRDAQLPLRRLMVAQDTGGAIRGAVRGDFFWGSGDKATAVAGRMKNRGHYWLLLPSDVVKHMNIARR